MHCENGVVVWDDTSGADFKLLYPEFAAVPDTRLEAYFEEVQGLLNNSPCSIVQPCSARITLYNLLIAWTAFDRARGAGIVGQIGSASQGSVSLGLTTVSTDLESAPYMTNDYGKRYWMMTAKYRTFFYVPKPKSCRC